MLDDEKKKYLGRNKIDDSNYYSLGKQKIKISQIYGKGLFFFVFVLFLSGEVAYSLVYERC